MGHPLSVTDLAIHRLTTEQENSTHQVASKASYEPYWYQNGQGGIVHWTGNDWRDVILPAIPLSHLYTQQMSYLIHGLEPDRKYEAKVQARSVQWELLHLKAKGNK